MKKKLLSIALSVMMVLSSVGMGISALAEELAAQPANNNVSAKASGEQEVETVEMDTLKYMTLNPQGLVSNMADGFVAVTEQGNSGGVHLRTAKIGASITVDFNGSGFEFYGKKVSGAGDLEISVDGGTDFYGARTTHRTGGINIISYTNRENNASDKTNPGTILDEEPTIFNDILIDGNVITNRKLWTVQKHLQQSRLTSFQQLSIQQ